MKTTVIYVVSFIVCACLLVSADIATATELVWVPINPSFGGPSYNATWLMASAQAQNKLVEKTKPYTYERPDPFEDFEYTLKRQYLYALSRKILNQAFGEEEDLLLPEGETEAHYTVGDYKIDVTTNGQITVVLTDITTLDLTTVEIPYF